MITNWKLRTKLLGSFMAAIFLVTAATIGIVFFLSSRSFEKAYQDRLPRLQNMIDYFFTGKTAKLARYAFQIAENDLIGKLLQAGDRAALEQILVQIFTKLKQADREVNTVELVDSKGVVVMRGHNPGKFGDNKAGTPLFGKALQSQKASSGFEISTSTGLLSLDAIAPVFSGTEFVGMIKVGSYPKSENLNELKRLIDADVAVVMEHREQGIGKEIMEKYDISSRYFPDQQLNVYGSTFPHDIAAGLIKSNGNAAKQLTIGEEVFLAKKIDISMAGEEVHDFSIIVAIPQRERQFILIALFKAAGIAVAIGIALLVVIAFMISKSIIRPINQLVTGLVDSSDQVNSISTQVSSASQSSAEGASEQAAGNRHR